MLTHWYAHPAASRVVYWQVGIATRAADSYLVLCMCGGDDGMAGTRTTPHRLMEFHVFGCDSLSPPPDLPAELYHTTRVHDSEGGDRATCARQAQSTARGAHGAEFRVQGFTRIKGCYGVKGFHSSASLKRFFKRGNCSCFFGDSRLFRKAFQTVLPLRFFMP